MEDFLYVIPVLMKAVLKRFENNNTYSVMSFQISLVLHLRIGRSNLLCDCSYCIKTLSMLKVAHKAKLSPIEAKMLNFRKSPIQKVQSSERLPSKGFPRQRNKFFSLNKGKTQKIMISTLPSRRIKWTLNQRRRSQGFDG